MRLTTQGKLLLLPQRYIFSSKSQPCVQYTLILVSCCCYHKGTYFQANHNRLITGQSFGYVVVATTKVHIFKQITTDAGGRIKYFRLLLLPQRYIFSSKSQLQPVAFTLKFGCCCYHKGTYFQANHN